MIACVEIETNQRVRGIGHERMKIGGAVRVRPIDRVLVASLLIVERQVGELGDVLTPTDTENIGVAVTRVIGDAGDPEVSLAVVNVAVADRSGKVAPSKNRGGSIDAAGVGDGLEIGIGPGLIVERLDVEREKPGVVLRAGQVRRAARGDAMVGSGEVPIIGGVAG